LSIISTVCVCPKFWKIKLWFHLCNNFIIFYLNKNHFKKKNQNFIISNLNQNHLKLNFYSQTQKKLHIQNLTNTMKIKILFPNTVKPTTSNIKISLRGTIPKLKETPNLQTSKAFSVKPFSNPNKSTLSNIKPTPSNIKPCFHEREIRSSMEERVLGAELQWRRKLRESTISMEKRAWRRRELLLP
jgi:hypothetical protein